MEISFASERLQNQCNTDKLARKEFGAQVAKALRKRLDDLRATTNLAEAFHLPGKLHPLKHDWAGCFAMRLDGGYRLVFACAHEPPPLKDDGQLDLAHVTAIRIESVEDYHD